jgi:hypothetical protein
LHVVGSINGSVSKDEVDTRPAEHGLKEEAANALFKAVSGAGVGSRPLGDHPSVHNPKLCFQLNHIGRDHSEARP